MSPEPLPWDDARIVAFDVETSGTFPEYALQPWRVKSGDTWLTSASALRHQGGQLMPMISQLFPTRMHLLDFLLRVVDEDLVVLGWNITFDISMLMAHGPEFEDLCMRVRWLDGMLLWKHLEIEPEYEFQSQKHLKRRWRLKPEGVDQWISTWAGKDEDVDFHSTDPADLAKLQAYNDRDNVRAWVISKMIWCKLTHRQQRAALIEAEALPMVAQANMRGMMIDGPYLHDLGGRFDKAAAACLEELAPHGMTEKIVRSPKQLATLMYDVWNLPVLKENQSKVEGKAPNRSTDKEVLHELALMDPRAGKIKEYREALNAKGKFVDSVRASLEYNGGCYTHPIAMIMGTYCVPGDVEVLTRQGWVRLDAWDGGDIMQVWPTLSGAQLPEMEFLPATRFAGPEVDDWVEIAHSRVKCDFTFGHTMPVVGGSGWSTVKAEQFLQRNQRRMPLAGSAKIAASGLTPAQIRVLVMVQADGYWHVRDGRQTALRLTFVKDRKVRRCFELLRAAGVEFTSRYQLVEGCSPRTEVRVAAQALPSWLTEERKNLGPWLFDAGSAGLQAALDEFVLWDGSVHRDGGFRYSSCNLENCGWVATVAHLCGLKASVHAEDASGVRTVHISFQAPVACIRTPNHVREVHGTKRSWCAETLTGFWLARSKGKIFITGNTGRQTVASKQGRGREERQVGFALHQMMRDKAVREIVIADPGYDILEFDAAGQEFRWMAEASGDETMLDLCQPGEDAHSFMGAQIVGINYRDLVKEFHDGDKQAVQHRYLGKFANLCCAEGTRILTNRGFCNIEQVRNDDLVWDGVEFVRHDGVTFSGVLPVITHCGVSTTPDHKVLVDGSWVQNQEAAVNGWTIEPALGARRTGQMRSAVWIVGGLVRRAVREVGCALRAVALRLRLDARSQFALSGDWSVDAVQGVRRAAATSTRWAHFDRDPGGQAPAEAGQRLVPAMPQPEQPRVSQLRRAWHRVQVLVGARSGRLGEGKLATLDVFEAGHRPARQRWSLRAWKPAPGYAQGELGKPTFARCYDIVNCGPRTRFAANGVIVHNSLQYRTSPRKLRSKARVEYGIPLEMPEAQRIHKTYQRSYPGVPRYWSSQIELVKELGYVETFGGSRVNVVGDWVGRDSWSMGSTAINTRIQGTGADQKYLAMKYIRPILHWYGARFLFDLHDGLYLLVPKEHTIELAHKLKYMLDNLPYQAEWGFTPRIPMPWDCKVGPSWGKLKDFDFTKRQII